MTDKEVMQMALVQMGINQYSVAELAPHKAVMAFNSAMEVLRAQLEQPYAEQARRVEQETQGRLRIDPVTGDVSVAPFTTPPAVQRKPLTDITLWEMWVESPSDVFRFARAIEAAHDIKGEA